MTIRDAEHILQTPIGTGFDAVILCDQRRKAKEVIIKAIEEGYTIDDKSRMLKVTYLPASD